MAKPPRKSGVRNGFLVKGAAFTSRGSLIESDWVSLFFNLLSYLLSIFCKIIKQ